jgi:hypothetical protein
MATWAAEDANAAEAADAAEAPWEAADAAEAPWEAADAADAAETPWEAEDAAEAPWEAEDAAEDTAEDTLGGLPLRTADATHRERVCAVRRWTRRESMWLVAHITTEKLATSSLHCRIGNWAATARAFKDEFHYERSEKSFATQAARLRDEPERLYRQPRERQADGVASERPPETRRKQPRDLRERLYRQPRERQANGVASERPPETRPGKRRQDDLRSTRDESRSCRWNSAEEEWLAARLEEHAAGVTRRLADGAQYAPLPQTGAPLPQTGAPLPQTSGAAGGRAAGGAYPRNGARGGVPWEDLATAFKAKFGKTRTAMALRFHDRRERALEQQLLQQRDTSAEVFRLLDG